MSAPRPLVLASASPRRSGILSALGLLHEVHPAEVDETPGAGESPSAYVERLARAKAGAVASAHPRAWIVAGDTVVVLEGELLGKPQDEEDAVRMLLRLAGRTHRVVSGLALVRPGGSRSSPGILSGTTVTEVRFRAFEASLARAYVATGEPTDKAGAYGIQGRGAALVQEVGGDPSGVVGLPVSLLVRLMEDAGRPYRFPAR